MIRLATGLTLACLSSAAFAQSTTKSMDGMKLSKDQPIQIQSDQLEIKDEEKKAYFTGNVEVVQGTTTMKSSKMTVLYKDKDKADGDAASKSSGGSPISSGQADIDKIFVDGKVLLNSGTQQATADNGVFEMATQTLVLTGKQVVLSDGPNVFKGCKLTVLMNSGQAKLDACGGRVEIMLDPKSKPSNAPGAKQ
ncbi:LptA/OstA family protein [Rhizobium oryzicola]|uniref:LptA/OstA family protein n=1 Tax=Rhizobium oryzicola TaxID=1232668 RepID=A0ABT8SQT9_9HYPH|nr:LptA/OstA family protein [Rhizobium oryzicola]MDO1580794.1 LptA/OstA family protein [Rhizobium oryzicola]